MSPALTRVRMPDHYSCTMPTLTPALAKLAAEPTTANSRRLWRAMSVDDRRAALMALLSVKDEGPIAAQAVRAEIAKARHFRPQVLAGWDNAKLAETGAKLDIGDKPIAWEALLALHLKVRTPMLAQFLDALGIKHENGEIQGEVDADALTESDVRAAAEGLLAGFDDATVAVYLLALRSSQPAFRGVDAVLKGIAEGREGDAASESLGG
jgi:hypothetical protein